MSKKAPVIIFASPKGGVGKTTSALLLASEFLHHMKNETVTVIDADPNYPFKHWAALGKKPANLNLIYDESEDTILDNIEKARSSSKIVIVDLEGTKNMRVTYAVSQADLVIIPVQGSSLDAKEAVEAIKLVKQTEKGFNKSINFAILFTRMSAAIQSRNLIDIAGQFRNAKMPILPNQIVEREAFKTMFSTGKALHDLSKQDVSGLEKAKKDSYYLAEIVVQKINEQRKAKKVNNVAVTEGV